VNLLNSLYEKILEGEVSAMFHSLKDLKLQLKKEDDISKNDYNVFVYTTIIYPPNSNTPINKFDIQ
jgi:hypothetical protein